MRFAKNVIKAIVFCVLSLICYSCYKDLYQDNTALGRNILSFSIGREKVSQVTRGPMLLHSFKSYNGVYLSPSLSFAAFYVDEDGYATVRAVLDSPTYYELRMKLPERDIIEGTTYKPEVSLYYVYQPQVRVKEKGDDGETRFKTIREAVYRKAIISTSSLKVDTYYPVGDETRYRPVHPVLAGEFSFSGHYVDSLGKVVSFEAEKGRFDVSDDPLIWGKEPYGSSHWAEYDDVNLED